MAVLAHYDTALTSPGKDHPKQPYHSLEPARQSQSPPLQHHLLCPKINARLSSSPCREQWVLQCRLWISSRWLLCERNQCACLRYNQHANRAELKAFSWLTLVADSVTYETVAALNSPDYSHGVCSYITYDCASTALIINARLAKSARCH